MTKEGEKPVIINEKDKKKRKKTLMVIRYL